MANSPQGGDTWSDVELAATVNAYIHMLRLELNGQPFVKAEINRNLRKEVLHDRTKGSVEFRMQNISAAFYDLRLPSIAGYLPATNVGSAVKERIQALLAQLDISDLEAYVPTADPDTLDKRVSALRTQALGDAPMGAAKPRQVTAMTSSFVRDPVVRRWILDNANGICEGCDLPAPFVAMDGYPYLEVHHVVLLANFGSDRPSNAIALCPNCHRRCHFSRDRDEFKISLYQKIMRLRIELPDIYDDDTQEFI